jgi:hypothetical protein
MGVTMNNKETIIAVFLALVFCAMPVFAATGIYYSTAGRDESNGGYTMLSGDLPKLTASDDNRYVSHGTWNNKSYNDNDYIEFDFTPNLPSCAIVEKASITFEWQRAAACENLQEARLKIWDYSSSSWRIDNFPTPLPAVGVDRTEVTDLSSYITTPEDVNNLKIWFQGRTATAAPPGGTTKHDLVKLNVTYTLPCDCYTDEFSCQTGNCDWCPECSGSKVNQWSQGKCVNTGTSCGYHCDKDYCGASCGADCNCNNYCSDDTRHYSGECSDSCSCNYQSEDCNSYDGWYDTGETKAVDIDQCTEMLQKEQKYRNYYCDPAGCQYSVDDTRWVDIGISNKQDGTSCNDGLFCTVNDQCNSGVCSGEARSCNYLNDQCNAGFCNENSNRCEYQPLNVNCDNGFYCDGNDHCDVAGAGGLVPAVCVNSGPAITCDDQNQCTNDFCSETLDQCSFVNDDSNNLPGEGGDCQHCYSGSLFNDEDGTNDCGDGCQRCISGSCQDSDSSCKSFYDDYFGICGWQFFAAQCINDACDNVADTQQNCGVYTAYEDNTGCYYGSLQYCSKLCGAECDSNEDCSPNECSFDYYDYCDGKQLVEYNDNKILDNTTVSDSCQNTCQDSCACTDCSAECSPPSTNNYCVKGVCGAECDMNQQCLPSIVNDRCYYNGGCSDGCECVFDSNEYCPEPGTVDSGICYYGEGACTENGCDLTKSYIRPCEYCDPLLGPRDITPPVVTDIGTDSLKCCQVTTLSAVINDQCSNVTEAEYFLVNEGGCGDPGTGTPMSATDGSFDSSTEAVNAIIDVPCPDGTYNLWIRGRDAAGNWGACEFYLLVVDNGATTTYNVIVNDMTVKATIEGFAVAAEYFIDEIGPVGSGTPMNAADGEFNSNIEDVIAELNENLSVGSHTVYVHGKNSEGYWGNFGSAEFVIYEMIPNIDITNPVNSWYKGTVTVSYTTEGIECHYMYINNGTESEWFPITCNNDFVFDTNNCTDGSNICTIDVRTRKWSFYGYDSVTFSVDNSAPIITYVSLSSSQVEQNSSINITSDGHDPQGLLSCYALLMSGDTQVKSYNLGLDCSDTELITGVPDGDYIIRVRARNNAYTDSFAEAPLKIGTTFENIESTGTVQHYGGFYAAGSGKCTEKWVCTAWNECIDGNRTRSCIDENHCNTTEIKPNEKIDCKVNIPEEEVEGNATETIQEIKYPGAGITGLFLSVISDPLAVLIIIIVLIVLFYLIRRVLRKRSGKNGKGKKGTVGIKGRRK